ncbi:MAG: hypothetical protein IKS51_01820 [Erysipelotrichaceae bacterium]|nr:hypothetical protein [Erysipelotrichaceae bacterium]
MKNKDGILWDISPADAKHKWGIKRTTFHDGLRELKEKGFIDFDENVIHQKSIYQGCENRTPSAKELYDIRTPSYTETEQETCENQHRNNITNNTKINKGECLNDNVEPLSFHPAEEFVF